MGKSGTVFHLGHWHLSIDLCCLTNPTFIVVYHLVDTDYGFLLGVGLVNRLN